jgi:hypothetical protein
VDTLSLHDALPILTATMKANTATCFIMIARSLTPA